LLRSTFDTTPTSPGPSPFGLGVATAGGGATVAGVRVADGPDITTDPRCAPLSTIALVHPVNALASRLSAAVTIEKTASVVTNAGREY
jgi:hypothetical protein